MRRKITAEFDTFDAAEKAALEIRRKFSDTKILSVRPLHPESIRLTHRHKKRFTLLPTAVTSMNYITALVETDYNYEDMNEVQKRQTSSAVLLCSERNRDAAEKIVIGKGGKIILPS